MTIQLRDGLILLDGGKAANHEDCCCLDCEDCTGTNPDEIQVNFSVVADDDCSECDPFFNNSFILAHGEGIFIGDCIWGFSEDPFTCANVGCGAGEDHIIIIDCEFAKSGADFILRVTVYECRCTSTTTDTCVGVATFEKNFGESEPDCILSGVHTLTLIDEGAAQPLCDWSLAICTVEAAP